MSNEELTCPDCCRQLNFPKPQGELGTWYDCRACGGEWSPARRIDRIIDLFRREQ